MESLSDICQDDPPTEDMISYLEHEESSHEGEHDDGTYCNLDDM